MAPRAGPVAPHEDSHPVSHTRLSRRVTGRQPIPLTLSLSPRATPPRSRSLALLPSVDFSSARVPLGPRLCHLVCPIRSCQEYDFSSAGVPSVKIPVTLSHSPSCVTFQPASSLVEATGF